MIDNDMLDAMRTLLEPIHQDMKEMHIKIDQLESKLQEVKPEIMDGVTVLLDTEFKRNYDLLGERLDEILVKMPSEDDMDIIDGKLAEHDSTIRVLKHDVNALKKAL